MKINTIQRAELIANAIQPGIVIDNSNGNYAAVTLLRELIGIAKHASTVYPALIDLETEFNESIMPTDPEVVDAYIDDVVELMQVLCARRCSLAWHEEYPGMLICS